MNFVANESLDAPVIEALRIGQHSVFSISESRRRIADEEVLSIANAQSRILLTSDKDFGTCFPPIVGFIRSSTNAPAAIK